MTTDTDKSDAAIDLAQSIKRWWKEHRYDVTGDYGEHNVYYDEPEFVGKAKAIIGDWERRDDDEAL